METLETGARRFLVALFEQTQGDPDRQSSMYDIGAHIDLERDASTRAAEILMGSGYVEIRSLSGAVGLTAEGINAVQRLVGPQNAPSQPMLCEARVMDAPSIGWVEQTVAELKVRVPGFGSGLDALNELIADIKTIEAQLGSPRPKTAIVREVLRSMEKQLGGIDAGKAAEMKRFLCG